jgi:enterochelin esterase family protein
MREIRPDLEPGVLRLASGATLVLERHRSRVLRRNPLGDPHVRPLAVYLPPGYSGSTARYPVVYCLAGFTGTGRMLLNATPWAEGLDERLDRLIAAGAVQPLIAVLPDCFTRYGGSQYVNSSATGRYEDYLVSEIVPHIDRTYRTLARPGSRAVMGKSSGGYGACVLAMRHPDLFGLMACHSGDMYFEYCYGVELPKLAGGLWKHGGLDGFLAAFDAMPRKTADALAVLNMVAMAACYSPDRDEPRGIALPVDPETGTARPEVWRRWLDHDPVRLAGRHAGALRRLRLLYLDCGTKDEFHLHMGARLFARRLKELGIRHVLEEFDDGHMQITYRYDVSLRRISEAFEVG